MRNVSTKVRKSPHGLVDAMVYSIFAQPTTKQVWVQREKRERIIRLIGAALAQRHAKWMVTHCCRSVGAVGKAQDATGGDAPAAELKP